MSACAGPSASPRSSGTHPAVAPALHHFDDMVDRCLDYARAAKAEGRPLVGIMCEYTPRELILAAGAVPVCLCGGVADTIPAAEQFLPANLCPLIKSTFGYQVLDTNPFLREAALVVAETTCDGKKKMFELLGASKPLYVLELPQKAGDPDAFEHWVREIHKFKEHLENRFGQSLTVERLESAIAVMNRERQLRRRLADSMTVEQPPMTGRQLLSLRSIISGIDADLAEYAAALERIAETPGVPNDPNSVRKHRVLLTGVPLVTGAERVLELIEDCNAVVVCMENCTGLKPILEDVKSGTDDPLRSIAEKYFHLPCSVMTPNDARLESLRALGGKFRPDCVIELVWHACLTYDIESARVRKFVTESLGLPYLKIVTDYSPADSSRIRTRVEALLETLPPKP